DTIVLDKTGTITNGKPVVTDFIPAPDIDADHLKRLVASAESESEHPVAQAIADFGSAGLPVTGFEAVPGHGIKAHVDGQDVWVGNRRLLEGLTVDEQAAERLEQDGKTAMFIAVDGKYAGLIAVADTIKDSAKAAVEEMKRMGLRVVMLTGDQQRTADAIARQVGIDEVVAGVLPAEKAGHVAKLQDQ